MTMLVLSDAGPPKTIIRQDVFFFCYHVNCSCGFIVFVLYASSINLTKNLDLGIEPLSLSIFDKIVFGNDIPEII
jgi:hypothetical protein